MNRSTAAVFLGFFLGIGDIGNPVIAQVSTLPVETRNYCGLYSIYGAALHEGADVTFASLLNQRYLSCAKGSSLVELKRAAEDHGLHALVLDGMVPRVLRHCSSPIVLYVRSDLAARSYDHYVLFRGYESGRYNCLDGDQIHSYSEAELLTLWGGTGIVVSAKAISPAAILSPIWITSACLLLGSVACAWIIRHLSARTCALRKGGVLPTSWQYQMGAILAIAVTISIAYHATFASGLLAEDSQTSQLQAAHAGDFIPKLSNEDTHRLYEAHSAAFVDARLTDDYDAGHIRGAISVPVDADPATQSMAMEAIPHSRPIVVYCQSSGCPFARLVASRLINNGFKDVKIYTDGWEGWHDNGSR